MNNKGKLVALAILLSGAIAGGLLWWTENYAYYEEVSADAVTITATTFDGVADPLPVADVEAIDADTSPLRFRACFTTPDQPCHDDRDLPALPGATPLNTPGWFDCYDAGALTRAMEDGTALAFLGEANFTYGFDRIVLITDLAAAMPGTRSTIAARPPMKAIRFPPIARPRPRSFEMPDLLLELFSEEIPARMQARAAEDLKKLVTDGLVEAGLTYAGAGAFHTPRRLALTLEGLSAESPTVVEARKGPRADAPQKALDGFLRSTGLTKDQLELRDDKKGQFYHARIEKPGRPAEDILAETIPAVIRNFPWPKSMRWGTGSLRWVRPLHAILCILSDDAGARPVPFEVDGIEAGDTTRGHRFMAPDAFASPRSRTTPRN